MLLGSFRLPVEDHAPTRPHLLEKVEVPDIAGQDDEAFLFSLQKDGCVIEDLPLIVPCVAHLACDGARQGACFDQDFPARRDKPMGGNALDRLANGFHGRGTLRMRRIEAAQEKCQFSLNNGRMEDMPPFDKLDRLCGKPLLELVDDRAGVDKKVTRQLLTLVREDKVLVGSSWAEACKRTLDPSGNTLQVRS